MMKIYRTLDKQLTRADDINEGVWICLTAPTENEVRQVATTLDIEPADLFAATDPEESARISLEDGYTLIIVDIPVKVSDAAEGVYTTIPLGIFCAVHKGKKVDNTVQVVTMLGYSLPIYIIALIFMFFFCVLWRIFPISGTKTAGAIYATKWDEFVDMLYHIALPTIVMTFASLGGMTRYVRSAMIDALSMDYIRTARAKGLKEKVVIYSHAWRNALLPIITSIIGWFISIFSGSVIIENTFSLNGMGKLYWAGLSNLDFELVLAIQMFYTIVALVGSLIMDISYGLVDPRVRVDK